MGKKRRTAPKASKSPQNLTRNSEKDRLRSRKRCKVEPTTIVKVEPQRSQMPPTTTVTTRQTYTRSLLQLPNISPQPSARAMLLGVPTSEISVFRKKEQQHAQEQDGGVQQQGTMHVVNAKPPPSQFDAVQQWPRVHDSVLLQNQLLRQQIDAQVQAQVRALIQLATQRETMKAKVPNGSTSAHQAFEIASLLNAQNLASRSNTYKATGAVTLIPTCGSSSSGSSGSSESGSSESGSTSECSPDAGFLDLMRGVWD